MEKEFVPYELAVKLKALGFDEHELCLACWIEKDSREGGGIKLEIWNDEDTYYEVKSSIKAPTFSQAFKWFRDKNIYATINTYHSVNEDKPFGLSIDYLHESGKWDYFDYRGESDFETYEEAELACLAKLIEIVETRTK